MAAVLVIRLLRPVVPVSLRLPFNPLQPNPGTNEAAIVLTTADGTAYHYAADGRLNLVVAPGGARLTVSDRGVVADDGQAGRVEVAGEPVEHRNGGRTSRNAEA